MTKVEILQMFLELVRTAAIRKTDPDDYSGCNTVYFVDQEQLMKNIEHEIDSSLSGKPEELQE